MLLAFIGWVVIGLVVGFIGTKVVNLRGDSPLIGLGAAVAAAVVAGLIHGMMNENGFVAFDVWSLLFAAIGAAVGVAVYHAVRSRSISHDRGSVRSSY